jgi:hypothetical protein
MVVTTPVLQVYPVIEVPHFTDGDTLWVRREWHSGWVDRVQLIARDDRAGVAVRLSDGGPGVNTPKKGAPGYAQSCLDLRLWVKNWGAGNLTLRSYGVDSFGRILGDLIPNFVADHPAGAGAVWHMREEKEWPAWQK